MPRGLLVRATKVVGPLRLRPLLWRSQRTQMGGGLCLTRCGQHPGSGWILSPDWPHTPGASSLTWPSLGPRSTFSFLQTVSSSMSLVPVPGELQQPNGTDRGHLGDTAQGPLPSIPRSCHLEAASVFPLQLRPSGIDSGCPCCSNPSRPCHRQLKTHERESISPRRSRRSPS